MPDYSGLPAPKINGSCTHNRKGIIASKKLRRESSPGVLYTLALPRGTENTFARRMVLASRFRWSSLRLPLSGMVYCEIATRTLEVGPQLLWHRPHTTVSRPTPSRIVRQPLSKNQIQARYTFNLCSSLRLCRIMLLGLEAELS